MTYNILDGGLGRESLILEVLSVNQPDILILQEVTKATVIQNFAKSLGMNYFFAEGNSKRHLGLLTRYPITFRQSYHPFPIRTTILQASIEYKPEKRLHLFGVHLLAFSLFAFELWRTWEISIVLREALKYQLEPCVIAGDFNTIAPTDSVDRTTLPPKIKLMYALQGERIFHRVISKVLRARFTDCYRSLHTETGYTYPPPKPNTRLDYIFANTKLKQYLRECHVVAELAAVYRASDHYPVLAKFAI